MGRQKKPVKLEPMFEPTTNFIGGSSYHFIIRTQLLNTTNRKVRVYYKRHNSEELLFETTSKGKWSNFKAMMEKRLIKCIQYEFSNNKDL